MKTRKPRTAAARIKQIFASILFVIVYKIPRVTKAVQESVPQSPSNPSIRLYALITPKIHPKVRIKLNHVGKCQ